MYEGLAYIFTSSFLHHFYLILAGSDMIKNKNESKLPEFFLTSFQVRKHPKACQNTNWWLTFKVEKQMYLVWENGLMLVGQCKTWFRNWCMKQIFFVKFGCKVVERLLAWHFLQSWLRLICKNATLDYSKIYTHTFHSKHA